MSESIGLVAGKLWEYLEGHGPSSVTKVVKESDIDLKNVNRAIGWLAKEDKIVVTQRGRNETIALK
ncbi:MAG: winged helix-turn-helix domain-containing protein [Piscirickettsiaceae bacterium]|jgi:hypothetical protein|nr:winged helix-turn-helix domain-containing protein [Piscirickettsiaceae bacterium]